MEKLKKLIKETSTKEREGNDKRKAIQVSIRTVGPWGGSKGTSFDDGTFSGIRKIRLAYSRWIQGITVVYDKDGNPTEEYMHGRNLQTGSEVKFAEIKLEDPEEFITEVSGSYGPKDEPEGEPIFYFMPTNTYICVRSLTFVSNQQTYGPYGVECGQSFSFTTDGSKIVGLMGRSHEFIDAIGFRLSTPVAPPPTPYRNGWTKMRSFLSPLKRKEATTGKNAKPGQETPKEHGALQPTP